LRGGIYYGSTIESSSYEGLGQIEIGKEFTYSHPWRKKEVAWYG